jgi:hypothetical protein
MMRTRRKRKRRWGGKMTDWHQFNGNRSRMMRNRRKMSKKMRRKMRKLEDEEAEG